MMAYTIEELYRREVERRGGQMPDDAKSQSYPLPPPISVNNLFANKAGQGRVKSERYRVWLNAAGWELKSAGPIIRVPGPVALDFMVPRKSRRMDLDNTLKPYIDMLVDLGAIDDDRNVEAISAVWCSGKVGRVVIRAVPTGPE